MAKCAVKCGFFSLRDCGERASQQCGACSRWVCPQHVAVGAEGTLCAECAGKRREGEYETDEWNRERVYGYRDRYYRSHSYRPFYYGYNDRDYYDDYDVRGFDRDQSEPLELGDESEADFFDS